MTLWSRPQLRKPLERSRKGKDPKKGTLGGPGGCFPLFLRNVLPAKKRRMRKKMRKETSSILVVCCGLSQTGLECVAYLQKMVAYCMQQKKHRKNCECCPYAHIWGIWAYGHMGICEKIWSSGVSPKRPSKMQLRNVNLRSVGHSVQKLWPTTFFAKKMPCILHGVAKKIRDTISSQVSGRAQLPGVFIY